MERAAPLDEELIRLYTLCPEAAVVSLDDVVHAPDKVNALVPPVRLTAAQIPSGSHPTAVRIASRETPPAAAASNGAGEWLVDPKDWLGDRGKPQATGDEPPPAVEAKDNADHSAPEPPMTTAAHDPISPCAAGGRTVAAGRSARIARRARRRRYLRPFRLPFRRPLSAPPSAPAVKPIFPAPASQGDASPSRQTAGRQDSEAGVDPHLELFAKNCYPSARECAKCHEEIYEQWSVSAHAYADVSPMFHKFEQKLNDLSQGTVGYFCMRCHAPVATAMCASRDEPIWNLPEVGREGVTCIACHRVQYMYGKSNGERRIEPGPIFAPVLGGIGGDGVADAIAHKDQFKVKTSPDEKGPGQDIHVTGIYFEQLTQSEFCTSCHQVAVYPGIKLEVVCEQYRASPACKKGIQCQDCHMGRVPGLAVGLRVRPGREDRRQDGQRQPQEVEPHFLRPELFDRSSGRVPVQSEGEPLDDAGVADVRLASRLGDEGVRGSGGGRQGRGQLPARVDRGRRSPRRPRDHRRESQEARAQARDPRAGHGERLARRWAVLRLEALPRPGSQVPLRRHEHERRPQSADGVARRAAAAVGECRARSAPMASGCGRPVTPIRTATWPTSTRTMCGITTWRSTGSCSICRRCF